MLVYSVLLFFFAAIALLTGLLMLLGQHGLIFIYEINSPAFLRFARLTGVLIACMSLPMVACGVLFLLGETNLLPLIGIGILLVSTVVIYLLYRLIQKICLGSGR